MRVRDCLVTKVPVTVELTEIRRTGVEITLEGFGKGKLIIKANIPGYL